MLVTILLTPVTSLLFYLYYVWCWILWSWTEEARVKLNRFWMRQWYREEMAPTDSCSPGERKKQGRKAERWCPRLSTFTDWKTGTAYNSRFPASVASLPPSQPAAQVREAARRCASCWNGWLPENQESANPQQHKPAFELGTHWYFQSPLIFCISM